MSNITFRSYNDMELEVMRATVEPERIVAYACALTQKKDLDTLLLDKHVDKLIRYLFTANHTSPFEHAVITVLIKGVSRSFLAQITRHRMGSFTSASQHYQNYGEYNNIISKSIIEHKEVRVKAAMAEAVKHCEEAYTYMISMGIPKEEARQVLPNAKAVNILWTVNARSLINFFNQRLCKRNVWEMRIFANCLLRICLQWFPELFVMVGPDCEVLGGCTQGKMKAEECIKANVPNFRR